MVVKDNLLVIRMDVAGLTQWGSSWPKERVCGRGEIRKNCGNLWNSKKHHGSARSPQRYGRTKIEEKYNVETLRRREIAEKRKSPLMLRVEGAPAREAITQLSAVPHEIHRVG